MSFWWQQMGWVWNQVLHMKWVWEHWEKFWIKKMKKPEELLKKAGFVLKSNYLESGNTIFAPHTSVFLWTKLNLKLNLKINF